MTDSQWNLVWKILLGIIVFGLTVYFLYFNWYLMAPHSRDPEYLAVYWMERELYYGSDCGIIMEQLAVDDVVDDGLIECSHLPHTNFRNTKNGTRLFVNRGHAISLRTAWLPQGEKVIVDESNGYLFRAKNGKVTDFVRLDSKLEAQLLSSVP
jgi:hypothetical protein